MAKINVKVDRVTKNVTLSMSDLEHILLDYLISNRVIEKKPDIMYVRDVQKNTTEYGDQYESEAFDGIKIELVFK